MPGSHARPKPARRPAAPRGTATHRDVLGRLGRLAARHPWPILTVAALFVTVAVLFGGSATAHLSPGGFTDPGAQSTRAGEVLSRVFHAEDPSFVVLGTARHGTVGSRAARKAGRALTAMLRRDRGVASVDSYWATRHGHDPILRSRDRRQALILGYATGDAATQAATAQRVARQSVRMGRAGLRVQVGGAAIVNAEASSRIKRDLVKAESLALLLTLLLLVLAFRGLIAAVLPLVTGGVAIVGTLLLLRVLTSVTSVSVYALNLTTALGLGLGIDYSLLLVSRFREELAAGRTTEAAVARTVRTAGRTVLFSAVTVAVSLLALLLFPEYFLSSFGYAGIAVVVLAATAALFVVPALLGLLGPRVNRFPVRLGPRRGATGKGRWRRFTTLVMRRPARVAIAVTVLLVAFVLPFAQVRLGQADDRVLPASASGRQVGDALRAGFSAFSTAPVDVITAGGRLAPRPGQAARYAARLSAQPGAAQVQARTGTYVHGHRIAPARRHPVLFGASGRTWFTVLPAADPNSPRAVALVQRIRAMRAPFPVQVTGLTAQQADTVASVTAHLPLALAVMALVTVLALFLMTGSLVIPVKALLLSAASLSATAGVAVWVFQQGHLSGVLPFTPSGYLDVSTLLLMFCLAFGLSMDYQVFLLSRIREEYALRGDTTAAVAMGLERTGRVVTTAAALLAIVFIALGTSSVGLLKLLGGGIAVALILDATLIRTLLLPALMRLLGSFNWWAPAPMRWLHARAGLAERPARPLPPQGAVTGASRAGWAWPGSAGNVPAGDSPAGPAAAGHATPAGRHAARPAAPRPAAPPPDATSRSSSPRAAAPRSQPARAATEVPARDIRAESPGLASTPDRAADQPPTSRGGTRTAPPEATSASTGMSLATTGTPDAIASSTGSPYPSASDGKANTEAARYTAGSSSSGTSGMSRTRDSTPSPEISPGSGSGKLRSK
jgi:putative drug exporter of the RND superfamily